MKISLQGIKKSFGDTAVVKDVSLEIPCGEMFFLLGPSGCGKTTLLRMLSGLIDVDEGEISFGERRINDVPANQRNCALVFQNYAIWPHLTVFENVAYGLRVRKIAEPELRQRVMEVLEQVRMSSHATRKPTTLSGGQQQRVALARAIVVQPDLLLFDEPLSNLDARLRLEMREEIQRLHELHPITSVYVTHDQEEALSLADRIAVMQGGVIEQIGTPFELYNKPENPFVASFMGEVNFFSVKNSAIGKKLVEQTSLPARGLIGFRPERVSICTEGGISAKVEHATYLGSKNKLSLKTETGEAVAAWTQDFFPAGATIQIRIASSHLLHYPDKESP